jgi:hypothetical protein
MTDTDLAFKNRLRAMRFTKRFRGSGTGVLRIAAASDSFPKIDFCCSDPQPPFGDIINWIKESCAIWSARFDRCAQFVAIFSEGACECWTFLPHQPPQRVREGKDPSLEKALEFANHMLSTAPGDRVNATWQPRAKHLAIEPSRKRPVISHEPL